MTNPKLGIKTLAVHAGEQPDPVTRAASPNLVMSSTYIADPDSGFSIESVEADAPYLYTRWSNPTNDQLERKLAALEGAEACVAFASGMAAISALFLHYFKSGDQLLMSDVAYAGASELTNEILPGFGIEVIKVNMSNLDELAAVLTPRAKLVYLDTPCNPLLRLTDIAAAASMAHAVGAKVAVDSTFATPVATRPLELGADFVIHSLTKYIGGHGDALGGALLGPKAELDALRQQIGVRLGGVISPFNAWLILRGAATLPLRMKAHEAGARQVAQFLEGHPQVTQVMYPGLSSHPQHRLAQRQMENFSGMLTFQVAEGRQAARLLAERLKIWHYAVSLGHHRSLLFYLPTAELLTTSFKLSERQAKSYRDFAGEGIFRVSVGIEDPDDLCQDLEQALAAIA
jgi:methionine-gamma-lyase